MASSARVLLMPFFVYTVVSGNDLANFHSVWPEADPSVSSVKLSRQVSLERVTALRGVMNDRGIYAYVIPTADAHNSQYIAPCDARREWISGLSGSSGTAVVTAIQSYLWTDSRYFAQFDIQVDKSVWGLMRQGIDPTIDSWLAVNMPQRSVVAVDPTTYTQNAWNSLEVSLLAVNVSLRAVSENLVDEARKVLKDPPPPRPNEPLIPLSVNYTGKISKDKISDLHAQMRTRGASALILTALDDIAYTLNIRGSDIPYNPVFFSYLVIMSDVTAENVQLFWGDGELSPDVRQHLSNEGTEVVVRPYTQIFEYIKDLSELLPIGSTIWLSRDASHAIHMAIENNGAVHTLSTVSPVALMKCVKNQVELQGFRSAHVRDGVAVVRLLRWLHERVDAGEQITEVQVVEKLNDLREESSDFFHPSFPTIAGAGENGAIIHYRPSPDGKQRIITKDDMFLLDSGGQYRDGTTDITRTRHMSSDPSPTQRLTFTRVLKGQILLGTAVFPKGITGNVLETLARKSLWDVGLTYAHGTGHGVGHFLNVHEGPSGISSVMMANDPGIVKGMIFSNEPGYYKVGEYGIRHEDLVEVIEINKNSQHILAEGLLGDFDGVGVLGFSTISLAPHQTACLDVNLLDDHEIKSLNSYHARVLSTLGPILSARGLTEDYEWLKRECTPIHRNSAILLSMSSPLLLLSIIYSLCS